MSNPCIRIALAYEGGGQRQNAKEQMEVRAKGDHVRERERARDGERQRERGREATWRQRGNKKMKEDMKDKERLRERGERF